MATFAVIKPFPLHNPRTPMGRVRGDYSASLATASQWSRGDLVEINSAGDVQLSNRTTAANVPKLGFAASDYSISPLDTTRYSYYTARDIPVDTPPEDQIVVFSYQAGGTDGTPFTATAGDVAAIQAQTNRELVWNTSALAYTIRDGTTNPAVQMLYIYEGVVSDLDIWVACKLLDGNRLGA